ncbi:MAG: hypothetical protein V1904_10570 [Bacteroidota bacterium]
MKNLQKDRTLIRFSAPAPFINEVIVSRVLADNSTEPIGKVYPDLRNEGDSIIYISTDNNGDEIFPPTSDFIEVETRFEKYAKELAEISLVEGITAESEEFEKREETIKNLRNCKIKNREMQQINL